MYSYELNATALHFGCLQGGHYCAICKVDDKFILYDDLNTKIIDNPEIFKSNKEVYMAVYNLPSSESNI